MPHHILRPRQALNKAYLRLKTSRSDMEPFKQALRTLLDSINLAESEEHAKNHLRDLLKETFYGKYAVNTKGKTDLVIHAGTDTKSPAAVLLVDPGFGLSRETYEVPTVLATCVNDLAASGGPASV